MNNINQILEYIVVETLKLNKIYSSEEIVKINYSAIFCQNEEEYELFNKEMNGVAEIIENTTTGPLYKFREAFQTIAGPLLLLKIRKPDLTRTQRGDADYTLNNYDSFKEKHLKDDIHFKLIDRGNFEMIELKDENFNVMSYFSSIPLVKQFGIE